MQSSSSSDEPAAPVEEPPPPDSSRQRTRRRFASLPWLAPGLLNLYFLLAGVAIIPRPGLQNDELFFAGPIFSSKLSFYSIEAWSVNIPIMVISYTGALKTWLYTAIFEFFYANVWSVRLPVLLMGIGTIWLAWCWVRRVAGTRAAVIATAFLATDAIFLLTDVLDWGPVAIQHLLLMGGLVLVTRWLTHPSPRVLAAGFFLWGLGVWDKAVMIWPLIGLAVASLLVFPRRVRRGFELRPALIALGAMLLGMSPLLLYNFERHGQTATANATATAANLPEKMEELRETVDGSALFGFLVQNGFSANQRLPKTVADHAVVAVSRIFGRRETDWMVAAWIVAFVALAVCRSETRRLLLFLLVAIGVAWLLMAFTQKAGAGAHHVILLWPMVPAFLGIAFAGIADRFPRMGGPAMAVLAVALTFGNVLMTNEYLRDLIVNGPIGGWTDAIFPLSASIDDRTADWIGLVDWGCLNPLETLHEGQLRLFVVNPDDEKALVDRAVTTPEFRFIQHTADKQVAPDINYRVRQMAEQRGYHERLEDTIQDSHGRPVFEVFRFEPTR